MAGDGEQGHRDGAAAQAQFTYPCGLALLLTVAVVDYSNRIRVLSADLQQVSTLTNAGELGDFYALQLLTNGRLLMGGGSRIRVLEGFPAALLGTKPSYKRPKKANQQQQKEKKKRARGASSTGRLVPKRSRSGASSSMAAPSSSDSEGKEQPGGSAAAEPLEERYRGEYTAFANEKGRTTFGLSANKEQRPSWQTSRSTCFARTSTYHPLQVGGRIWRVRHGKQRCRDLVELRKAS